MMRKLIVGEFLTLDGVIEASEVWQPPFVSDDVAEAIHASIHSSDALLMGRVTYEMFAGYWPSQTNNQFGIADKLNSQPKFVVSSTLRLIEARPFSSGVVLLRYQPAQNAAAGSLDETGG